MIPQNSTETINGADSTHRSIYFLNEKMETSGDDGMNETECGTMNGSKIVVK